MGYRKNIKQMCHDEAEKQAVVQVTVAKLYPMFIYESCSAETEILI